jgi:multisubunit Na+/H+ antiporter MnhB subunit
MNRGGPAALGKSAAGGGNKMSDLNQRIEAMYQSDRRGAWILIVLLWITVLFVLFMSWPYIPDGGVKLVSAVAAAAVLIFNTASITSMLRHSAEDKEFIYGLDIKMLDEANKNR